MLKHLSHAGGAQDAREILFSTPFNYLFGDAARSEDCLLPHDQSTIDGLKDLGSHMGDAIAPPVPVGALDSSIPAAFTYLGQFIDHDLTARTDRNSPLTNIGNYLIEPQDPDTVVAILRNGRRPQLDLDSVFGDGPRLVRTGTQPPKDSPSDRLYEGNLTLKVFQDGGRVDLPERKPEEPGNVYRNPAVMGDMRNDENVNVSQLHTSFLLFYNKIFNGLGGSDIENHIDARKLTRWAYQYVVVNDYLMRVCDQGIVKDTLTNGPRYFGPTAGKGDAFMPLEFAVAGFRFGHSMVRPFYRLNDISGDVEIVKLLGPELTKSNFDPTDHHLVKERVVDWSNFVGSAAQSARRIDTKLAKGLFLLPFIPDAQPMKQLAVRNLLRGYNLSIPHAQAVCQGFGVHPLAGGDLIDGEDDKVAEVLRDYGFHERTPLWYYVLREAALQHEGESLGEIGSRIVCETIIGMLKSDPNSYLNNKCDDAVTENGIQVASGPSGLICTLESLLKFAGAVGL